MARTLDRPATYEDLLKVPENMVAEIVEGDLFASPRPASPHAFAASRLLAWLIRFFDHGDGGGPGGWWFLAEPELRLVEDVLVPDIAGWRKERMPAFPVVTAFRIAPDWVCEVVSPETAQLDRTRKLPRYARHGVPYAWVVDPISQTLEVYGTEGARRYTLLDAFSGNDVVRAVPFDAVPLDLATLWIAPASVPS